MRGKGKAQKLVGTIRAEHVWTQQEYLDAFASETGKVIQYWGEMLARRTKAVDELCQRLTVGPGSVAEAMRWGYGLDEDIWAEYATEALRAVSNGRDVQSVLQYQLDVIEDRQRGNMYRLGSSSRLANAVEGARAEVASQYGDKCRVWLEVMSEYRAMGEIL